MYEVNRIYFEKLLMLFGAIYTKICSCSRYTPPKSTADLTYERSQCVYFFCRFFFFFACIFAVLFFSPHNFISYRYFLLLYILILHFFRLCVYMEIEFFGSIADIFQWVFDVSN